MSVRLPLLPLLALLAFAVPAAAQGEPELKSSDARKLAKPFGDWADALIDGKSADAAEAQSDLVEAVDDLTRKLKDRSALSLVADLEVMFDEGRDYETSGSWVDKGRATTYPLGEASFIVRLPSRYNPKKQNYPMMLLLDADITEEALEEMPEEMTDQWVIVAPQLAGEDADTVVDRGVQVRMLASTAQASIRYRVDRNRIYVVANGEVGVKAAADLVSAFPHFFAGLASIGGAPEPRRGAENLGLVQVESGVADIAAAAAWALEADARAVYPTEFTFLLTREWAGRGYWVHATEFDVPEDDSDSKSRFSVQVDRDSNTITLDSEGVYTFAIYLNDAIVDLDREVTIVRNGEPYKATFSRTVGTMLEHFTQAFDSGAVFPVLLRQLDVPRPAEAPGDGGGN